MSKIKQAQQGKEIEVVQEFELVKSILPNGKCGDGEIMMNKKECKRKYPK